MKKTKYIKDKDGKFAGSIGAGKTTIPQMAPIPAGLTYEQTPNASRSSRTSDVFLKIFTRFARLESDHRSYVAADLQSNSRHLAYIPIAIEDGKARIDVPTTYDPDRYPHQRAAYAKPCTSCGETDPSLRYRSGKGTACYDCTSYNLLVKNSSDKGWKEVISQEDYLTWCKNQKRTCYFCGVAEKDVHKLGVPNNRTKMMPEKLGTDRWDSNQGYVAGNIVLSCYPCNQLKSDTMDGDEFIKHHSKSARRHNKERIRNYRHAHRFCCPQKLDF